MIVTNLKYYSMERRELEESNWKLFCGTRVIYFNLLEMDFSNRVEEMLLAVSGNCLPAE